jgi:hypothetical protein
MGMIEVQAALARLYTDIGLARRFVDDPGGVASDLSLCGDDAAYLVAICPDDLLFFVRSLLAKRFTAIRDILPVTEGALSDRFAPLFEQFAATVAIGGEPNKHAWDALRFASFLLTRKELTDDAGLSDRIRQEQEKLEFDLSRRLIMMRIRRLERRHALATDATISAGIEIAIWVRPTPHSHTRQRHWRFVWRRRGGSR